MGCTVSQPPSHKATSNNETGKENKEVAKTMNGDAASKDVGADAGADAGAGAGNESSKATQEVGKEEVKEKEGEEGKEEPKTDTDSDSAAQLTQASLAESLARQSNDPSTVLQNLGTHKDYPERVVPKAIPWEEEDADYDPPNFTHDIVHKFDRTKVENGWADPEALDQIPDLKERKSYVCGDLNFNEAGYPLNPMGRTGIKGRGLLGKWGPNFAADPLVTRYNPENNKLQLVAIQRQDNGQWAMPGGMVDHGETVSATLQREFQEEAGNVEPEHQEETKQKIEELFQNGREVYKGYAFDPRNTDNAWIETAAVHFHCNDDLASSLQLAAGDDAAKVAWLDVDENTPSYHNLYANHKEIVNVALKEMSRTKSD